MDRDVDGHPDAHPGPLLRLFRDRRVAFVLVGGVNTVIGGLWFLLFDGAIGTRWGGFGHYPALVLTYLAAILCAFVLHRTLVFRVHGHVWADLTRFSSVYVSAFLLNLVLLAVFVHGLHWHPFLSQCVIIVVTTTLSWFAHGRFSFRRPPLAADDPLAPHTAEAEASRAPAQASAERPSHREPR